VSQRFRFGHDRTYVFCKLMLDPVYDAVLAELRTAPDLPVLDIGCGPGLLAAVLRAGGLSAPIHGIDYDPRKTEAATRALQDQSGCTFAPGDARTGLPGHAGHVTILDILQYFTPEEVAGLLAAAAARVAPGGRLLIRTCLREDSWRFRLTRVGDWIAKTSTWMKDSASHYPTRGELTATLQAAGLTGTVRRLSGRLPFNNYLLAFSRPG
jgi:2-polyprenyl-3-methyl-5-hydroxy-6-metoxy-1,4-benzoquinol methylase